jgi:hypothetical protein
MDAFWQTAMDIFYPKNFPATRFLSRKLFMFIHDPNLHSFPLRKAHYTYTTMRTTTQASSRSPLYIRHYAYHNSNLFEKPSMHTTTQASSRSPLCVPRPKPLREAPTHTTTQTSSRSPLYIRHYAYHDPSPFRHPIDIVSQKFCFKSRTICRKILGSCPDKDQNPIFSIVICKYIIHLLLNSNCVYLHMS